MAKSDTLLDHWQLPLDHTGSCLLPCNPKFHLHRKHHWLDRRHSSILHRNPIPPLHMYTNRNPHCLQRRHSCRPKDQYNQLQCMSHRLVWRLHRSCPPLDSYIRHNLRNHKLRVRSLCHHSYMPIRIDIQRTTQIHNFHHLKSQKHHSYKLPQSYNPHSHSCHYQQSP